MTILEGIILGLIQGVFMFVPVSSTSHLALAQQAMAALGSDLPPPDAPELILFDLVVHVGTLVSIAVVMWASLRRVVVGGLADLRDRLGGPGDREGRYLRLIALGVLTVAVTGVLGLAVREWLVGVFALPLVIAGNLVLTGAILWWTDAAGPRWRGLRQVTPWLAVMVGVAQAAALLPGLSRSGLTIAIALALGLRRRWAAEYSFFIAIPTILAGSLVQAWLVAREGEPLLVDGIAFATGFVTAAIVGIGALALVLSLLYRARFRIFSIYVWALAAAVAAGWVTAS